ncbi:MAG TPA: thioredoxin, partial [Sphingomicrobium sp.]|nr:thioredoxin [Sphingomicrobium sp.]
AAAAAAFWFFAPPEWKERAGIAQAGATPLQLMITTSDRQALQSGNELVAISGRVINPTDREQNVPPIMAELRDKQTNQVVHRWTIPPPARVIGPRSSASFNSAEVDVPKGGDELTVTLGS